VSLVRRSNEGASACAAPRVLHVFGGLGVGGAEVWLAGALERGGLDAATRHDFCLLSPTEGPYAEILRRRGHRIVAVPAGPIWSFPGRFRRFLRDRRYDAVHSHVLLFSGVILAIAAAAGIPVRVAHAHNDSDGRSETVLRRGYRALMRALIAVAATRVVGCTRRAAEAIGGTREQIRVLPYGVDLAAAANGSREERLAELGLPADARVWGHLGRLTRQKNQRFLLEVFVAAYHRDPRLYLLIAGDGELRGPLEAYARGLGVADRVRFLGLRDDARSLLASVFDVLLMPSFHEGLPVSLLEAQAAGLPCLISDRVNPETVVLHESVQALALGAGFTAWADAGLKLLEKPRIDPVVAAQSLRRAGFDAAESWDRLSTVYAEDESAAAASLGDAAEAAR